MKKLILFILLGITSLTISSCKKDDSTDDSSSEFYFTAKIDGVAYEANPATIAVIDLGDAIEISAKKSISSMNEVFMLAINPFDGEGTYLTNSTDLHSLTYVENGNYWETDAGGDGTIVITNYDEDERIIEGTFSFTGFSDQTGTTIEVTDGKFKAPIQI